MGSTWATTFDQASRTRGVLNDWLVLPLALVAFVSVTDPYSLFANSWLLVLLLCAALSVRVGSVKPCDLLALALFGFTALSLSWTVAHELTVAAWHAQFACSCMFIAVRAVADARRRLLVIAGGFLAGCAVSAVRLVTQSGHLAYVNLSSSRPRLSVGGLNSNYTAYALATGAAVVVLVIAVAPILRVPLLAGAFVVFSAVLLTGTRGGLLGLAAVGAWAVLWQVLMQWRRVLLSVLVVAAVLAVVAVSVGWLDSAARSYALGQGARDTGELNGRLILWPAAREVIGDHPMTGVGAGTFPAMNSLGIFAHNAVLDVGAGLGLIGIALGAAVVIIALHHGLRVSTAASGGLMAGVFLVASLPPLMSGYWFLAPAFWVAMAFFTRPDLGARPEVAAAPMRISSSPR